MILRLYNYDLGGPFFLIAGIVIILFAFIGKYDAQKWSKGSLLERRTNKKYGELGGRIVLILIGLTALLLGFLDLN